MASRLIEISTVGVIQGEVMAITSTSSMIIGHGDIDAAWGASPKKNAALS